MPAQENKAIVRRYIDELNKRNAAILDELVGEVFREEVRNGYTRRIQAFPDYLVEIQDMIAEGEQVMVEWTHRGTHLGEDDGIAPTGKVMSGHAISIYRVVGGQIVEARGIWDQADWLHQLGLIDDPETILEEARRKSRQRLAFLAKRKKLQSNRNE